MIFMLLLLLFVLYTRLMVLELGQMPTRTDQLATTPPTELAGKPGVPGRRVGGGTRNKLQDDTLQDEFDDC